MNKNDLRSQLERLAILNNGYDHLLSAIEDLLREGVYKASADAVFTARLVLEAEMDS